MTSAVNFKRLIDRMEQIFSLKGLCQKLHRPGLHHLAHHRDVSMRRHEDDGYMDPRLSEFPLELYTGHSGKLNIQNQAANLVLAPGSEELLAGPKLHPAQSYGLEQVAYTLADRCIIINDKYGGYFSIAHRSHDTIGIVN